MAFAVDRVYDGRRNTFVLSRTQRDVWWGVLGLCMFVLLGNCATQTAYIIFGPTWPKNTWQANVLRYIGFGRLDGVIDYVLFFVPYFGIAVAGASKLYNDRMSQSELDGPTPTTAPASSQKLLLRLTVGAASVAAVTVPSVSSIVYLLFVVSYFISELRKGSGNLKFEVARDGSPQLLHGQGWGRDPMAAVVLERAALTAAAQGKPSDAAETWQRLLDRFPEAPGSAWARLALGNNNPVLHQQLLQQQPAHPAALTLAARDGSEALASHQGALHLARWNARRAGALGLMRDACEATGAQAPQPDQRQTLAQALAKQGHADTAVTCLQELEASPETQLAIGRSLLLHGDPDAGTARLLTLAQNHPNHPASLEAARILSEPLDAQPGVLDALPAALEERSAAVAAARVRLAGGDGADAALSRWPNDPDIWQLQWDLAREAFLAGDWEPARDLLKRHYEDGPLPSPLETRRLFWLGLSHKQLGETTKAERSWRRLIGAFPGGYYRWRAMEHLGVAEPLALRSPDPQQEPPAWQPLNSHHRLVNELWRLGQVHAAWEAWQAQADPAVPPPPEERLAEGRLRLAIGDTWMGLDQLWWLSLRWRNPSCHQRTLLHRSQFPRLFEAEIQTAAEQAGVQANLLRAIAKQESRFAPGVVSPAGAVGVMQLMPSTATEMADAPTSTLMLKDPADNFELGARYLHHLLEQWESDPFRSIASYNAGPGAVSSWPEPTDAEDAALWVERIPYPETRFYTKKVLDNLLGYSGGDQPFCEEAGRGVRQKRASDDAADHDNTHQEQADPGSRQNPNADEIKPGQQQG